MWAVHWHICAQTGWTALICAAAYGHFECARLLLNAGADTEAKTNVRTRADVGSCQALRWGR